MFQIHWLGLMLRLGSPPRSKLRLSLRFKLTLALGFRHRMIPYIRIYGGCVDRIWEMLCDGLIGLSRDLRKKNLEFKSYCHDSKERYFLINFNEFWKSPNKFTLMIWLSFSPSLPSSLSKFLPLYLSPLPLFSSMFWFIFWKHSN